MEEKKNCEQCKYMFDYCLFTDMTGEICEGKNGFEKREADDDK